MGGPSFPFLNRTLYQLLIEPKDVVYSTDDVIDLDVKNKIQKLQTADEEELNLLSDWLVEHGVYGFVPPYTEQNRDTMIPCRNCTVQERIKHIRILHNYEEQFRGNKGTFSSHVVQQYGNHAKNERNHTH